MLLPEIYNTQLNFKNIKKRITTLFLVYLWGILAQKRSKSASHDIQDVCTVYTQFKGLPRMDHKLDISTIVQ